MKSRIRPRLSYANVMVTLLAFVVLGGGAYAAHVVNRARIANNAKQLGGFPARDYSQALEAKSVEGPIAVGQTTPKSFQTLLRYKLANKTGAKAPTLFFNQATVENEGAVPASFELRITMDGKPEEGVIHDTVAAGSTQNVAGILQCDLYPPGTHTVELQARASDAPLVVQNAADDGFRPIVIPPSHTVVGS
jgi:hypothetical protein